MTDRLFVDTNILIYAHDLDAGAKNRLASSLLMDIWETGTGILSIQVLQEFYHVATQKIELPLPPGEALEYLHYMAILETVQPDFHMVVAAIRIHQKHAVSFWDGLILQAAKTAGCSQLISEDLQHGFALDDLVINNPFIP